LEGRKTVKTKVTHVITGLETGGAETMLYRLLARTDGSRFDSEVVSMTDIGPIGQKIKALGVPVRALGMRRGVPNPSGVLRLARWLRRERPQVVQTWMYQADLVGGLAAALAGRVPVVWGVHSTGLDPRKTTRLKRWTVRACVFASRVLPSRIVYCSQSSKDTHEALGYTKGAGVVVPNGADPEQFFPDTEARESVRSELGVASEGPLVGLVARFDPAKDHLTFVRAAALLHDRLPHVGFVLCGNGITWENRQLARWIDEAGVRACFYLLGPRTDIPRLTAALDISTSSSYYGEAWPLAVGEAMACGLPCVVTEVGDSPLIVGQTGLSVQPKDPQALADAWHKLLTMGQEERAALGAAARRRIERHFSLPEAVASYERLYERTADRRDSPGVSG
jgi:glycosyltransferase involved in cell wall biosynthesis